MDRQRDCAYCLFAKLGLDEDPCAECHDIGTGIMSAWVCAAEFVPDVDQDQEDVR